jgi:hypothetical protein
MEKLQLAKWDGNGIIHTHCDTMVDVRTELADTGIIINDQSVYGYFTNSLSPSLDLFITLYDDSTYDVDLLCYKFAKHELRHKLAAAKEGKADATADVSLAMFGQASASKKKERKKRDYKHLPVSSAARRATSRQNSQTARRRMRKRQIRRETGR